MDGRQTPLKRVAGWCYLTGGLDLAVFGVCGLGAMALGLVPAEPLEETGRLAAEEIDRLRRQAPWLAGVTLLLGAGPGAALILLARPVRRNGRRAMAWGAGIAGVQAAAVGFVLANSILVGLQRGQVASTLITTAIFGGLLFCLIATTRGLLRARRGGATDAWPEVFEDPWR